MGQEFAVKAKIHTLGGFSAHAGQSQLLNWAGQLQKKYPRLYLVHGELDKMLALQNKFHEGITGMLTFRLLKKRSDFKK